MSGGTRRARLTSGGAPGRTWLTSGDAQCTQSTSDGVQNESLVFHGARPCLNAGTLVLYRCGGMRGACGEALGTGGCRSGEARGVCGEAGAGACGEAQGASEHRGACREARAACGEVCGACGEALGVHGAERVGRA
jgi:hypothetical protein